VPLSAGKHRIRIDHFNETGPAAVCIRWIGGPIEELTSLSVPYLMQE